MRAIDCQCGEHLEAADDDMLFEVARAHADQVHADTRFSDAQVWELITANAYDAAESE
jgi:hypothetical protein